LLGKSEQDVLSREYLASQLEFIKTQRAEDKREHALQVQTIVANSENKRQSLERTISDLRGDLEQKQIDWAIERAYYEKRIRELENVSGAYPTKAENKQVEENQTLRALLFLNNINPAAAQRVVSNTTERGGLEVSKLFSLSEQVKIIEKHLYKLRAQVLCLMQNNVESFQWFAESIQRAFRKTRLRDLES